MLEHSEVEETMNEEEAIAEATPETADDEIETTEAEAADETSDEAADEGKEIAPEDLDTQLIGQMNRAARLLRNRRDMLAKEAEAQAERTKDLVRALKLLELKPKMTQGEMAELLGMPMRDVESMLSKAEANDIVARIESEEGGPRETVVYASEDAVELAEAQGAKRKKLVPQLSAESARELLALLDQVIDPLVAMGLDNDGDRGPRGGRDDRGGRGFGGRGGDRGGRGGFGGGRGGDRGGHGGFGGDRGPRGGRDDRGGRGGFGGRDDRGPRGGFGGRDDRGGRGGFGGGDRGGRGGFGGGRGNRDAFGPRGRGNAPRGGLGNGSDHPRGGFGGDRGGRGGFGGDRF